MPRNCPSCRSANGDADATCGQCGLPLDIAGVGADVAVAALAGATADAPTAPREQLLWAGRGQYLALLGLWCGYAVAVGAAALLRWLGPQTDVLIHMYDWLLLIVIGPPALWLAAKTLLFRWATGYRLTHERLFIDRGLLSRCIDQTELIRVEDVRVRQGPIGRLLGLGDVIVLSNDETDAALVIRGIARPVELAELIRTRMRKLRKNWLFVETPQ